VYGTASVEFIPFARRIVGHAGYFPVQTLDKDLVAEGSEMVTDIRWQVIKPAGKDV
jgi:disulfide oxidoreductase YuzD